MSPFFMTLKRFWKRYAKNGGVSREQILKGSRTREISQARRVFFLRAHEETGQSFAALGRLCGFFHTSVREAIAKARMGKADKK
jgi:chromosomal replication initiation ATPase DnaA